MRGGGVVSVVVESRRSMSASVSYVGVVGVVRAVSRIRFGVAMSPGVVV